MKTKILTTLLILVAISCYGKKTYTLTKSDFIKQFSVLNPDGRVYCFDDKGNKVWFYFNKGSQLVLKLNDSSKKILLLHTVKYYNDTIKAVEYNVWYVNNDVKTFSFKDVASITIDRKFQEMIYDLDSSSTNMDSLKQVVRQWNDSLQKKYSVGKEWVINLIAKEKSKYDTVQIIADVSYNINFKDGSTTNSGIVEKITEDSIYITSHLSPEMALEDKREYAFYKYPLSEIAGLTLIRTGSISAKKINIEDYNIVVNYDSSCNYSGRIFYSLQGPRNEILFYRAWLTGKGVAFLTEKEGRAYWYEGESYAK